MRSLKHVLTLLPVHFRLPCQQYPKTDDEKVEMAVIPYSNIVGCLIMQWF